MDRERWMHEALSLADEAAAAGEVPVGCVIVREGRIVGRGRNRREEAHDPTAHAEIEAIREASAARGDWRLDGCSIYVTLEPCPMCAGALLMSRLGRCVFGAADPEMGCCGSVVDLFYENYGHRPAVYSGVCAEESRALLQRFFRDQR